MRRYPKEIFICFLLVAATLAVYFPVGSYDFITYDDPAYITKNKMVRAGWTREGFTWAFTTTHHRHWHPITWLSHMTDCHLFGLNAGRHHLTSLFFHLANTILLFLVFRRMTGALMQSAFVAALFALHPLHVETAAWIADRKDILCTLFLLLAMWAYARYAERPGLLRYGVVLVFFGLGLMSKSMVLTLPLIFLLLDLWPLDRFQREQPVSGGKPEYHTAVNPRYQKASVLRLVGEKILFFVLVGAGAASAVVAMHKGRPVDLAGFKTNMTYIAEALVSYVGYIEKMIWPHNLALPYLRIETPPQWHTLTAGMLLLCISILVIRWARKRPYLVTGWLWYLVTLLPVIGLVKHGPHSMGDRYTYIPLIGLFIMIAWGVPDLVSRWRYRKIILGLSAGLVLLALMLSSAAQVRHWENDITLYGHTVKATENNAVAHNNLGNALRRKGRIAESIEHYTEALRIWPGYAEAHNNLGIALKNQGRLEAAVRHYAEALRIKPKFGKARQNFKNALKAGKKQGGDVLKLYGEFLRINPNDEKMHYRFGNLLKKKGKLDEAVEQYSEALKIRPNYVAALNNLGNTLKMQGKVAEAIERYGQALRINPRDAKVHNNLANALKQQGKMDEAIEHYDAAVKMNPRFVKAYNNLADAYMQKGLPTEAIEHYSKALSIDADDKKARQGLERAQRLKEKASGIPVTVEEP